MPTIPPAPPPPPGPPVVYVDCDVPQGVTLAEWRRERSPRRRRRRLLRRRSLRP